MGFSHPKTKWSDDNNNDDDVDDDDDDDEDDDDETRLLTYLRILSALLPGVAR